MDFSLDLSPPEPAAESPVADPVAPLPGQAPRRQPPQSSAASQQRPASLEPEVACRASGPVADVSARQPKTFRDLVAIAAARPYRSDQERRVAVAQLRATAWILTTMRARAAGRLTPVSHDEVVLATIPCDPAWINDHLPPRYLRGVFQMKPASFSNALTTCRKALAACGLIDPGTRPKPPVDSAWGRLIASLRYWDRMGVRSLARWCHVQGIPPSDMSEAVIERYRVHVRNRRLQMDIPDHIRTVMNAWNTAVRSGRVGPAARLLTIPRKKPIYTLATVNPVFDAEMQALGDLMAGKAGKGPRKRSEPAKLRPRSVRSYLHHIKQAVTAHDHRTPDRASIRMADLLQPEAFDDILTFFYDRGRAAMGARTGTNPEDLPEDAGVGAQTSGIANALMWVARHYLKLPDGVLADLRDRASAYHPEKPDELNPKVRARLDQLAVPVIRGRLLRLPWSLMRLANETRDENPKKAARLAMTAAAIVIEIYCPLRLDNLTQLRIGENVVYDSLRRRRIEKLFVPLHKAKNSKLYEWPLDRDAAQVVEQYIRDFRPILMRAEHAWLFPADDGRDGPRSVNAISAAITGMIDEHVGAQVNVHLFRAFAACILLEHSPGALNDVRLLLGHKSFETTLKYYAYLRPKIVAVRHAAALREARLELDPLVQDWLTGKGG
jgi:integrase